MQFTRLRLNGFKSFVDPTDLVIQPGLTGVVGPNGCGKSNLLEALRWVMGENRPTAMRGAGMEDVIFAGTDSRGARHFAEVTLQIDNRERLAPSGLNDADTLDIVRRITRDAGSAYKINGKEARARDVQMLFADASTGAHSPALVRQGQISELINAKPKARRRILEEAAGISGLYQRRHEAELRLRATETNLERLGDVIDQLAQQRAQLARQARQAERYRQIGMQLRAAEGMLLYRRWREADHARLGAEAARQTALRQSAAQEAAARAAQRAREAADARLPALREEEAIASALLQRLKVARDTLVAEAERAEATITALRSRISQLAQDLAREDSLNTDAISMIAQLEDEAAELAKAAEGERARLDAADGYASATAIALQTQEATLSRATEDVARLSAQHQSATRQIDEQSSALVRAEAAAARAEGARADAEARLVTAEADLAAANTAQEDAAAALKAIETELDAAEQARAQAQLTEAEARSALAEAEGETGTLRAEHAALSRLLERDKGVGARLLDQLRVDPGHELALGAALGDDLSLPLAEHGSGWHALAEITDAPALPHGLPCLAAHVTAPPELTRRLMQIAVVSAEAGWRLHGTLRPGQRLVSLAGDFWRWDGLHMAAKDAPSAAALRLQQINRRTALERDLEAAGARLAEARAAHQARQAQLDSASAAERAAREARRCADQRLTQAGRAALSTQADRDQAKGRREASRAQLARLQAESHDLRSALRDSERQRADLPDLEAERTQIADLRRTVEAARITMMSRRAQADELRHEIQARGKRADEVTRALDGWRARLGNAKARMADLVARKTDTEAELSGAEAAPAELAAKRDALAHELDKAEARFAAASDDLSTGEAGIRAAAEAERAAERAASDAREARARAEARAETAQAGVAEAADRITEAHDCGPPELLAQLGADPDTMPDAPALEAELMRLRQARDALGAVNLRAEEDARVVAEEHATLVQEKADLEAAITKLRAGIHALNREGRERLLAAFDKVNANFSTLFSHLFGGGEARLVLVESDDPLDAGLEIMCQPPGKKLATLSLLSGGEQTLTALALIFAVFLANPAPICVLDEVDAPLDDANVSRFCDLLDEMTRRAETRYLIITHNAISMARMDRLFGVTMGERGVSQLVSVDLKRAESLVA